MEVGFVLLSTVAPERVCRLICVKDNEWCFMRNSGGTVDLFHPEVCMMRFIFLERILF